MAQYTDQDFSYAPQGWNTAMAIQVAQDNQLELTDDHWEAIKGLQEYFSKHDFGKRRELVDALEEKFHSKGGMKYLYRLFPSGPVAQGCKVAGIEPPSGSIDQSFGSVV
jgi:tRNA 2-thiouridine synthesizing protein E